MDGLALSFMARGLNARLAGSRVDRVTQPDHDLLVLYLRGRGENLRLLICVTPGVTRLHLTEKTYENPEQAPMFCMLMRKHLQGGRLLAIEQLYGDRLLKLVFLAQDELGETQEKTLYFEAMGKHTNLSLVSEGKILDAMRHVTHQMSRVRQMLPGFPFEMPPRQDKLVPETMQESDLMLRLSAFDGPLARFLFHHVNGLSQDSARELATRLVPDPDARMQEGEKQRVARELPGLYEALVKQESPQLLMSPEGLPKAALPFLYVSQPAELQQGKESFSQAVEELYFERDAQNRMNQRAQGLFRAVKNARDRLINKRQALLDEALTEEEIEGLRVMGELLTSSLHGVPKGAEYVDLHNYYTGEELRIPLDNTQSPAANAQRFFKRYRKAHTARKLLSEQLQQAQEQEKLLEEALYYLEEAKSPQELSEIRAPLTEAGLLRREGPRNQRKKEARSKPLRFLSKDGLVISVGRNSLQNERLLKEAAPNDLWLHARDIPGSHVIVSLQGKEAPEVTIRQAAMLAAYYSSAHGAMAPVDYTLRRYVKKTPGGPAGAVNFSNEKTLRLSCTREEMEGMDSA